MKSLLQHDGEARFVPKAAIVSSMLNDAKRRKFDVVMAWAIDRLGRSLVDLLHTIQELEAAGVDLYLDQQSSTPRAALELRKSGGDLKGHDHR
jgi:hypothetical protein